MYGIAPALARNRTQKPPVAFWVTTDFCRIRAQADGSHPLEAAMSNNAPASNKLTAVERHYSVTEIAELWNMSDDTVRNIFFDEPGVIKIGRASGLMGGRSKKVKRHYFTLRIPESVLVRVHDRLMHKRPAESAAPSRTLLESGRSSDLHAS